MSDRHGPLPVLLHLLTLVTGLVDAVTFLTYGRVFVANMTGNVVFLGFALGGVRDISIGGSLVALAAFLAGALLGARIDRRSGTHRGWLLARASAVKIPLLLSAATVSLLQPANAVLIIALLGVAMGLQNAVARALALADLTTTVLTMTLTGIAADSKLAGGTNPRLGRRFTAVGTMFAGALAGGAIVVHAGVAPALFGAATIEAVAGVSAFIAGRDAPAWTRST